MFEPISQSLYELMMFSVLGFVLALLYEPFRIIRLFIKTGAVAAGIQDFLFLAACGLVVFAYSLEFGSGYFRYFYIIGIAFGATVYFLTAGRVISFVMRTFANAIKAIVKSVVRLIYNRFFIPIWKLLGKLLGKIAQKTSEKSVELYKVAEKHGTVLKNTAKIRYNDIKAKKRKVRNTAVGVPLQESQNGTKKTVIRARVIARTRKAR